MTPEEKVEELIKEGVKHPLPAGITDAATLDKYLKNHTNTVASTHEELTC